MLYPSLVLVAVMGNDTFSFDSYNLNFITDFHVRRFFDYIFYISRSCHDILTQPLQALNN